MIPFLAQGLDNIPAPFIKNALALLLAAVVGASACAVVLKFFFKKKGLSTPRRPGEPRAAEKDCRARYDAAMATIEKLKEERKGDMRQLHEEINSVNIKVASLQTEAKNSNAWLERMDEKLDELTSR